MTFFLGGAPEVQEIVDIITVAAVDKVVREPFGKTRGNWRNEGGVGETGGLTLDWQQVAVAEREWKLEDAHGVVKWSESTAVRMQFIETGIFTSC